MTTEADPIIGAWYQNQEKNLTFKVVAIDEMDDSIEIQYQDGDIGEYDRETWYASNFDPVEAPDDWRAAFDDLETDDLGYSDPDVHEPNPNNLDIADWYDRQD